MSRRAIAVIAVVAVITVAAGVGSIGFFIITKGQDQDTLASLAGRYFQDLGSGDGEDAYGLLCARAQATTSPEQLAQSAAKFGTLSVESTNLAGNTSDFWPWSDTGSAGARLLVNGKLQVRYLTARRESGRWTMCPDSSTAIFGRAR